MIQLIVGEKGKGKTKILLDKVNSEVKEAHGNIVYLDKSTKHMYELNNKVRLIDVSGFGLESSGEFIGFIYGILSQDHDLEQMYLDSFLKISQTDETTANTLLAKLQEIGEKFNVTFVISISVNAADLDEKFKENIIAEL
ncbi:MAG: twitching motility protein PilT [Candidatus Choladocola sp.]|nr:twitching motility protein PilT [Candidatus Choladocola sp.]